MASFVILDRAAKDFEARLRLLAPAQRTLPTPCAEFNVRELVTHQIQGMREYTVLLNAATTGIAAEQSESVELATEDWVGAFSNEYRTMSDAFRAPGVLECTVPHPTMGDTPTTMLLDMRVTELAVHGWDLARAIGADETLDPEVVASLRAFGEPLAEILPSLGIFGSGASGNVPDSAPLQTRLLDLLGRRP